MRHDRISAAAKPPSWISAERPVPLWSPRAGNSAVLAFWA
jgi:hypothetical protein